MRFSFRHRWNMKYGEHRLSMMVHGSISWSRPAIRQAVVGPDGTTTIDPGGKYEVNQKGRFADYYYERIDQIAEMIPEAASAEREQELAAKQSLEEKDTTYHFGCCPNCQRAGYHSNFWRSNMCACHVCKYYWYVGDNLFTPHWPANESHWYNDALMHRILSRYKAAPEA